LERTFKSASLKRVALRSGIQGSVYDTAFWPNNNDPRIRILRVTPENAEFWEGAGTVVTAVKLIAAIASGERMNVGANEKVGFPQGGRLAD
jgi:hypothetical protein